jgi:DNA invertase Pin-like site-specific DNA recombinase
LWAIPKPQPISISMHRRFIGGLVHGLPMLGVFAEFGRGIIRERVNAGLARAKAKGTKLGRRRVRPSVEARILELRNEGHGIHRIRKALGLGTSVVQRVFSQDPWEKVKSRAQAASKVKG